MTMHPEDDSGDGKEYFLKLQKRWATAHVKSEPNDVDRLGTNYRLEYPTVMINNREVIILD
jgi:hypothetical protein